MFKQIIKMYEANGYEVLSWWDDCIDYGQWREDVILRRSEPDHQVILEKLTTQREDEDSVVITACEAVGYDENDNLIENRVTLFKK